MSVNKYISKDKKQVTLSIVGRFDFSLHQIFRDTYIDCNDLGTTFILQLNETSYMDSSALGMILLLKDHAEKYNGKVIIKKPNEIVNKILNIAQFNRLMTIEV